MGRGIVDAIQRRWDAAYPDGRPPDSEGDLGARKTSKDAGIKVAYGSRAKRDERRATAEETLELLKRGTYSCAGADGAWVEVDISSSIAQSLEGTFTMGATEEVPAIWPRVGLGKTQIDLHDSDTLDAAGRLVSAGLSVVALNFASAKHPGGGWLGGSEAQEENVARRSSLYTSLTCASAQPFYNEMRAVMKDGNDGMYSNALVYSPHVVAIRDGDERLTPSPFTAAFITSPAVNAGHARKHAVDEETIRATLLERARKVLQLAASKGHDGVVLGAWGCGVFRNDPSVVAAVFDELLTSEFRNVFKVVSFALRSDGNRTAFERCFGRPGAKEGTPTTAAEEAPDTGAGAEEGQRVGAPQVGDDEVDDFTRSYAAWRLLARGGPYT